MFTYVLYLVKINTVVL